MPKGVLLNVNVPLTWNGGVRFTRQSQKVTRNVLQEGTDQTVFSLLQVGADLALPGGAQHAILQQRS